jgi:hypothetical protein
MIYSLRFFFISQVSCSVWFFDSCFLFLVISWFFSIHVDFARINDSIIKTGIRRGARAMSSPHLPIWSERVRRWDLMSVYGCMLSPSTRGSTWSLFVRRVEVHGTFTELAHPSLISEFWDFFRNLRDVWLWRYWSLLFEFFFVIFWMRHRKK